MSTVAGVAVPADVLRRICADYAEMPGLRVTQAQAQRLWALDADTCMRALNVLIEAGFLRRTATSEYARLTEGRAAFPPICAASRVD